MELLFGCKGLDLEVWIRRISKDRDPMVRFYAVRQACRLENEQLRLAFEQFRADRFMRVRREITVAYAERLGPAELEAELKVLVYDSTPYPA